jgi:hypothetical protein
MPDEMKKMAEFMNAPITFTVSRTDGMFLYAAAAVAFADLMEQKGEVAEGTKRLFLTAALGTTPANVSMMLLRMQDVLNPGGAREATHGEYDSLEALAKDIREGKMTPDIYKSTK